MTELKVNLQGSWKRILAMITVAAMCFTVIYVSPVSASDSDGSGTTPTEATTPAEPTPAEPTPAEIPVTGITLDKTTLNLEVGKTDKLTATVAPENATDKAVTWTTSDAKIAEVKDGTVTAKAAGKATITAKAGDKTATCAVTVKEKTVTPPPADNKTPDSNTVGTTKKPAKATVTLNATKLTMKKGTSTKALKVKKASVKGDKIKAVKTSNKKVVAVTKKGQTITLKAKKTGKATITVTMNSGAKATVKVTVNNKKVVTKKLTMSKKTAKVKKGKKLTLTVTRNPINATEKITWKSSNKKIATVKNGKVTVKKNAKAGKKVTITARTTNGKKATCKITVTK
ncbi:hypothetical protein D3Z38_04150 [Clostridiales bacterium]|nr:hypothetical protein [Clostridiales bacterium]